jgi:NAD(P)-dependent dehydrogenase (short-subunit alcohol dehydrogenase family)
MEHKMKAVVVGATGLIGKAVANLLSDKGYELVRVSRNTRPGLNIEDPASIDAFYKTLGQVDAVICAAGSAGFGPLPKLSDQQFQLGITSKLLGQANLVRKGLSNLRPGGVFVLTGGMLAYSPSPQTSAIALVNAGLEGFVRGAALDLPDARRIVIVHPPFVRDTAVQMGMDGASWPSAETVAQAYLKAVEGKATGQPVFVEGYGPA